MVGNNDIVFEPDEDNVLFFRAMLPTTPDTYSYTLTATCNGQTVEFSFDYTLNATVYRIIARNPEDEDFDENLDTITLDSWLKLQYEVGDDVWDDVYEDYGYYTWSSNWADLVSDNMGGVDCYVEGGDLQEGDNVSITCSKDGTELITSYFTYVYESSYSLVLSTTNPEGDASNISETQGFCSDSDYYVILLERGQLIYATDQFVEYNESGDIITPSLDGSGWCVWQCLQYDPSISEIVCYDGNHNTLATLQTSCE